MAAATALAVALRASASVPELDVAMEVTEPAGQLGAK